MIKAFILNKKYYEEDKHNDLGDNRPFTDLFHPSYGL